MSQQATCKLCKSLFAQNRYWQVFCSAECRTEYQNEENRKAKAIYRQKVSHG